ncbi:16S rRNA (cytosine(1402)-N(4))-methyltransferase RsmH [Flammeovirgaceae bacterium SG7u.111]|nr:16S rRNA (cytosine(1402)-N(4))-methyltransferase RsmH [Flammeovirgaceae bacterium SG7u.132]WPO33803.1 16S rRNA (cytosine(1402)-N(4))-methyltransferase RsmH [Flammeovirgaceae bacterium SG7u.111]
MYHVPVMLEECMEGLDLQPGKVVVDVTFGGGGHSKEILKRLPEGKLLAFDQDQDAAKNIEGTDGSRFKLIEGNFRYIKKYLKLYGYAQVDSILADLGISSHQIDKPERGFSTRWDAPLDMRMDNKADFSARDLVNTYREPDLIRVLSEFGEVRNARTLAASIMRERVKKSIDTTAELVNVLEKHAPKGKEFRYYAQVFQALRIEVNEEIEALKEMLEGANDVLKPGGRLVVMSYHSLEDRLVKNFIRAGNFKGDVEKDMYGNPIKPLEAVNRKPIIPTNEEIAQNPRARSAKLRVAKKL